MPRLRPPPEDVRNLSPAEYRDARRQLVTDAYNQQQSALDRRAAERRKQKLADSAVSLIEIRDGCIRKGMDPVSAVNFAAEIEQLRLRKENAEENVQ